MLDSALKQAKKIADGIVDAGSVEVVTHIDADGIAAGAIAMRCMERAGVDGNIRYVKQLDEMAIEELRDSERLIWFTDLGSGMLSSLDGLDYVITDHHTPAGHDASWRHFNPYRYGVSGERMVSGAGLTFLVALAMDERNSDMADLAMVGAAGDVQDAAACRHTGWNSAIADMGEKAGVVSRYSDLRAFGRQTRPLYKLLQYADDPMLPGLTGRAGACRAFLQNLDIPVKEGRRWKKWMELEPAEKRHIISSLVSLLISRGFGHHRAGRLVGEVYEMSRETEGTQLRDAREYATLLNATARYGHADVGLQVCLGDRDEGLRAAYDLLQQHRRCIAHGIRYVKREGLREYGGLHYFNGGSTIRDTVVGIIAGMLLHSSSIKNSGPLVGFAMKNGSEVKASARVASSMTDRGIDLASAMQHAARQLGGIGGGHPVAAGATIPRGEEESFLALLDREVQNQLA
jgi:RecJ-like exonuclease